MHAKRLSPTGFIWSLSLALPVVLVVAISIGSVTISFADVFAGLFSGSESLISTIVLELRLPRALLAAMIGAMLAVCGGITQSLFRNPLADPSLIGVTAGASLGASFIIFIGATTVVASPIWQLSLVSIGAFLGGVISVIVVYRLSVSATGISVPTMLLAGIGITAFAGSLTSLLEFYASNQLLRNISLWRMGGLDGVGYLEVTLAALTCLFMLFTLEGVSPSLNAMLLGESEARYLGVDTEKLKTRCVLLVAGVMGVAVALAGAIAFVGLVVPHIVRLLIGPDHRYLLPACAIFGAILLLVSDAIARVVIAPAQFPVGLVTSFIGAPVFISLLRKRHIYGLS